MKHSVEHPKSFQLSFVWNPVPVEKKERTALPAVTQCAKGRADVRRYLVHCHPSSVCLNRLPVMSTTPHTASQIRRNICCLCRQILLLLLRLRSPPAPPQQIAPNCPQLCDIKEQIVSFKRCVYVYGHLTQSVHPPACQVL